VTGRLGEEENNVRRNPLLGGIRGVYNAKKLFKYNILWINIFCFQK
jgi:hypothetical protein